MHVATPFCVAVQGRQRPVARWTFVHPLALPKAIAWLKQSGVQKGCRLAACSEVAALSDHLVSQGHDSAVVTVSSLN